MMVGSVTLLQSQWQIPENVMVKRAGYPWVKTGGKPL